MISIRGRLAPTGLLLVWLIVGLASPVAADRLDPVIAQAIANPQRTDADRARDARDKPAALLAFMGVRPGMRVADVLAAGGYWSELLSYVVGPTGSVISHTVKEYDAYVTDERNARFGNGRLPNVAPLHVELAKLDLGDQSLDLILMVMVYHDIYYHAADWPAVDRDDFFARIRRALKPGGELVIVDSSALPDSGNRAAQDLHRIEAAFAKSDVERAGFSLQAESDVLSNPGDDRTLSVFDKKIQGHQDRFVFRFVKR